MNKADAIPSMRAAETRALRAVEQEIGALGREDFQQEYEADYAPPKYRESPPAIDPVIAGLLTHLPAAGSVWPIEDRKQWLDLMEGSFKLIFKDKPAEGQS